jgi:ribonuclease Z
MRPSFYPKTINGPFDDPGVFIPFEFQHRAMLFDLGDNYALSARDILKISHIFVSHTHIDHFTGFDRVLRISLGREKSLCLYGPEGFLNHVQGKLSGYCWNLVHHYSNRFVIEATEVREDRILTRTYPCQNGFAPSRITERPFTGILLKEPSLTVSSVILNHGIPCLAFSLSERFHINILKDRLTALNLSAGPWLQTFKDEIFSGNATPETKDLARQIAMISPGQKITYITDVLYNESDAAKMIRLAKDSDHLFIEAAFSDKDKELARQKCHLTARQAGEIAGIAHAKQLTVFHFSPRYTGMEALLYEEAESAFKTFNDRWAVPKESDNLPPCSPVPSDKQSAD